MKSYDELGYAVIHSSEIIQKVNQTKSLFLEEFIPRMSQATPQVSREIIKRFSDHPMVANLFLNDSLLNILRRQFNFNVPVKCGPTVSHYTSNDTTGNGYGLPYHQDYPSMASSKSSVICWLNLVDSSSKSHGIEIMPSNHKNGILPGNQTDRGYALNEDFVSNKDCHIPEIKAGELLLMSSFTPHRTFVNSNFSGWKLSISQRFDDLADLDWAARGYRNAYSSTVDREMFKY